MAGNFGVVARWAHLVFGTPFWGGLARAGQNVSAPLAGIFFPVRDKVHKIVRLPTSSSMMKLSPNVVFFNPVESYSRAVFDLLGDLLERHPGSDLHFPRDPSFWDLIDA